MRRDARMRVVYIASLSKCTTCWHSKLPVFQGGVGNAAGGEPVENQLLTCGSYAAYWDGKYSQTGEDVASGIYLFRLEVDGKVLVKKMIVRKQ
jgi:hypothetical protein